MFALSKDTRTLSFGMVELNMHSMIYTEFGSSSDFLRFNPGRPWSTKISAACRSSSGRPRAPWTPRRATRSSGSSRTSSPRSRRCAAPAFREEDQGGTNDDPKMVVSVARDGFCGRSGRSAARCAGSRSRTAAGARCAARHAGCDLCSAQLRRAWRIHYLFNG